MCQTLQGDLTINKHQNLLQGDATITKDHDDLCEDPTITNMLDLLWGNSMRNKHLNFCLERPYKNELAGPTPGRPYENILDLLWGDPIMNNRICLV